MKPLLEKFNNLPKVRQTWTVEPTFIFSYTSPVFCFYSHIQGTGVIKKNAINSYTGLYGNFHPKRLTLQSVLDLLDSNKHATSRQGCSVHLGAGVQAQTLPQHHKIKQKPWPSAGKPYSHGEGRHLHRDTCFSFTFTNSGEQILLPRIRAALTSRLNTQHPDKKRWFERNKNLLPWEDGEIGNVAL